LNMSEFGSQSPPAFALLFSNWRPKPVDAQCPHGERQLVFASVQIGIFVVPWGVDQRLRLIEMTSLLDFGGEGMGSVG
jgi:hypothetical protein